jgi:hypothetical protein
MFLKAIWRAAAWNRIPGAALAVILFPVLALATTFLDREFPDSVRDAPVIVRGKTGLSYADWGKGDDGGKRIYTYYELQPTEVIKGAAPSSGTIMLRQLGGEKDGIGMQVAGTAHFERGEDVVVFLNEKNVEGSFDVRNMMMGKFDLERDSEGNEVLVGPGLGLGKPGQVVDSHGGDEGHGGPSSRKKWTLESLRQIVDAQKNEASAPPQDVQNSQNQASLPHASPSSSRVASPVNNAAPQLQPTGREDPGSSGDSGSRIAWIVGGLGVAAILGMVLRKRQLQKKNGAPPTGKPGPRRPA